MFQPKTRKSTEPTTEELLGYANTFALPYSDDAEAGIVSAILYYPEKRAGLLAKHPVEQFFHQRNASVIEAIKALDVGGIGIDVVSLTHALRQTQVIDKIGGPGAVSDFFSFMPIRTHVDFYSEVLLQKFTARQAIRVGAEIVYRVHEMDKTAGQTSEHPIDYDANAIVAEVSAIAQRLEISRDPRKSNTMAALMDRAFEWIEDKMANPGLPGYSTGISNIDDATGGIVPGEAWLIAGGTSDGKTALAMQIMLSMALDQGLPVVHYLGESLEVKWSLRCLAHVSRVPLRNLLRGDLTKEFQQAVGTAAHKLKNAPIFLEHCPGKTHNWIIADARDKKRKHDIKMFIVDYLQKFPCGKRIDNREQQVAQMSADYISAASDMEAAVMMLSALNDDGMIRESRAPAYDADNVLTLSVPQSVDKRTKEIVKHEHLRQVWIGKSRNDERNKPLYYDFNGSVQTFVPRLTI